MSVSRAAIDGVFVDGDWSIWTPVSPPLTTYPFKGQGDDVSYFFTQDFTGRLTGYVPPKIDSRGPGGTYLVDETPVRSLGGGDAGEVTRTYAIIPASRVEPEGYVKTRQLLTYNTDTGAVNGVAEITAPCTSYLNYDYFFCPGGDTSRIPLQRALRYQSLQLGDVTYILQTGGEVDVAEDSKLARWMGNIFARVTRRVPPVPVLMNGTVILV